MEGKEQKREDGSIQQERVWTVDINNISIMKKEVNELKKDILNIKSTLNALNQVFSKVSFSKLVLPTDTQQTQIQPNSTDTNSIKLKETVQQTQVLKTNENIAILEPKIIKQQSKIPIQQTIRHISTGNDGVPTDNPTDTQQTQKTRINTGKSSLKLLDINSAVEELKNDLLRKFKLLSQQEFRVFSAIYSLEESGEIIDYSIIATKLNLTESSIRDYIMRLEKKGIPIIKEKLQNRKVALSIRKELRDLFTLDKLLKIRESVSLRTFLAREYKKDVDEIANSYIEIKDRTEFEVPKLPKNHPNVVDNNTNDNIKKETYY